MRDVLTTLLEVTGFALLAGAAWLVAVPLGVAVAGAACIAIGWLTGRRG